MAADALGLQLRVPLRPERRQLAAQVLDLRGEGGAGIRIRCSHPISASGSGSGSGSVIGANR